MVAEYIFERDFVLDYFTDLKGLGYTQLDSNLFNAELLLVPIMVEDYIWMHYEQACNVLVKTEFNGDSKLFLKEFCASLSNFIFSKTNVAIALNPAKYSFEFKSFTFDMFKTYNLREHDHNLYGVVSQFSLKFKSQTRIHTIKPDIGIFVNGILFSYIELKMLSKGQSAKKEGRGKIIHDYIEMMKYSVTDFILARKDNEEEESEKLEVLKQPLFPFHKLVHLVALDTNEGYIMRNIEKYYKLASSYHLRNAIPEQVLRDEMLSTFYIDSIYTKTPNLNVNDRTKAFLKSTFHKDRVQDEICYLNFNAYDRVFGDRNNRRQRNLQNKNNQSYLVQPRPNQKYALNKVCEDIAIKYLNESNPNFQLDKLRAKLEADKFSPKIIEKEIEKRSVYTNNKNQYSLLLQYSAGFGKTYIMCWLALMIKDMLLPTSKKDVLFDKILLVSDRIDLRDQTYLAMHNMNIDKTLFKEAENKEQLKNSMLDNGTRVIIVNIQKFPFIKEFLSDKESILLKDKRICFLIDEVHRSNSGEQNQSMLTIFDEISSAKTGSHNKKNLVIGLTATPSDETLARYGEYLGSTETVKWTPFDFYTMKDAIKDGFVLNPLQGLIAYSIQMEYQEDSNLLIPKKETIYTDEYRIKKLSNVIVDTLLHKTFHKINKTGKAMLACKSISSAKLYFKEIKQLLAQKTENSEHARFKDARVYIVYSQNQETIPSHILCSDNTVQYADEGKVINAFKADRNGIMIVVDKLQTGFDEPKLHTLFLDKEITGINAVQTLCRVNRTTKGKNDCLVIDFSIDNINIQNIITAFNKFEGMVSSSLDTYGIKENIDYIYKKIGISEIYGKFYFRFNKNPDDMFLNNEISDYINIKLADSGSKLYLAEQIRIFLEYISCIKLLEGIVDIDKKYTSINFLKFLRDIINLVKTTNLIQKEEQEEASFIIVDSGEILYLPSTDIKECKKTSSSKFMLDKDGYCSTNKIEDLNLKEDEKANFIKSFKDNIATLSLTIMNKDNTDNNNRGNLKIKILNPSSYPMEEREKEFLRVFSNVERRKSKLSNELADFIVKIKPIISYIEKDFCTYVLKNGWEN